MKLSELTPLPPEEARNKQLVTDHGNQYLRPGEYGLYLTIPLWWRGFIFHVLKPRDFATYAYICSQCDNNAIAFPTGEHLKTDMGRSHNATIYGSIGRLEQLGFVMKVHRPVFKRNRTHRNVYQRPSPEYTLVKLLEAKEIDGCLRPRGGAGIAADYDKRHGAAIAHALTKLLGKHQYSLYAEAAPRKKVDVLTRALEASLAVRRAKAKPALPRIAATKSTVKSDTSHATAATRPSGSHTEAGSTASDVAARKPTKVKNAVASAPQVRQVGKRRDKIPY